MTNYRPWPTSNFPRLVCGMPQRSYPCGGMGMGQQRRMAQQQHSQANYKLAPSARNPPRAESAQPVAMERGGARGAMADVAAQDALTLQQLTSAEPHQQKQMIGEHLYRKIYNMYPQLAGKITGTAAVT